jgi:prolyl-tRNA synthetase
MVHGDDAGLKLPPVVAPVQVIVVPIWRSDADLAPLEATVDRITERLGPVARVKVDWRDDRSPGYKFNQWELKGVPLRIEVGPRDVAADQAVLVRRDTREKQTVPLATLPEAVATALASIQADLLAAAEVMLRQHTSPVDDRAELTGRMATNAGWSLAHWCRRASCEAEVKAATKATIRCIPRDQPAEAGACIVCGRASPQRVIFARAY